MNKKKRRFQPNFVVFKVFSFSLATLKGMLRIALFSTLILN